MLQPSALTGIRVLDLSRVLAGPYCSMMLGDYGADVVKIERPRLGDDTRKWGPPWAAGESAYFLSTNRNKRSMTLDLQHPTGQQVLRELVGQCDILLENFKTGTLEAWGLDYPSLQQNHPGLIFCSISGYGRTGPQAERPGYDFVIQAEGGIMSLTGPAQGEPHKVGVAIADITAGLFATTAILAALHHREKTGLGQFIDISLLDSQVGWLANMGQDYLLRQQVPTRQGNAHAHIVPYQTFATADGHMALAIGNDTQYQRLCQVAQQPELWQDPRFQTNAGRVQHRQELISRWQAVFLTQSTQTWLNLLQTAELPVGAIHNLEQVFHHPQVEARNLVHTIPHPTVGSLRMVGPVAQMSATPPSIQKPPPLLGEHTDSVLRDWLGYTSEQILNLRQQQVL